MDEQPVDELERAGAEAWVLGGRAAEIAAKQAWRDERRKTLKRTTATFAVERAQRRVLRELQGWPRAHCYYFAPLSGFMFTVIIDSLALSIL